MQNRSRTSATAPQMNPTYASALVQRYMRSSMTADADADSSESPGSSRGKPSPSASPDLKKPALARRASNIIRAAASSSDDESPGRPAASARHAAAQQARGRGGEPRLLASQHSTAARRDSVRQAQSLQSPPAQVMSGQVSNLAGRRQSAAVLSASRASATGTAARRMSSPPKANGALDARRESSDYKVTGMQQSARLSSPTAAAARNSSSSRSRIPVLSPSPPQKAPPPGALSPRSSAMLVLQQRMQQRQSATHDRGNAAPEQPPLPLQQQRVVGASQGGVSSIRQDDLVAQQLRDITQSAATAIARARGTSINAAGALQHAAAATVALARTGRLGDRASARSDSYDAGDSGRPSSPNLPPPNVALAREAARRVSSPTPGTLWALGSHSPGSQAPQRGATVAADNESDDDDDALRDLPGYGDGRRPSRRSRQQAQQRQREDTVQQEPGGSPGRLQASPGENMGAGYDWEQPHDTGAAAGATGEVRATAERPSSWQMEGRRLSATGEATATALAAAAATARRRSSMHEGAASPSELAAAAVSRRASAALAAAAATAQAAVEALSVSPAAGMTAEATAQHGKGSAGDSSSEDEGDRVPGSYRGTQVHHGGRPSGFQSPELVKQRSSRHSSKQGFELQEQQRHSPRSPLSRQHAASVAGHSAHTHPPGWHAGRDIARPSSAAAAAAADVHAQRSKHRPSSSSRAQPRMPVPRFDDSHGPFDRYSHGAAADMPAGSSSAGLLLSSGLSQLPGASTRTGSTADRVLKHLLDEGIDQTPVTGKGSKAMSMGAGSSGGSSPSGSATDGNSSGSSGGSRAQRRAASQQEYLHGQSDQQHAKDERVLVERTALQAARRAASPVRMRRCSSPDVADAVVSAATASAAAAAVAEHARQHQADSVGASEHKSYRSATRVRDAAGSSARRAASAMDLTEEQQHKARLAEMLDSQAGRAVGLLEAPRLLPGLVGAPLPSATPLLMRHSGSRRYARSGTSPGAMAASRTSAAAGVSMGGYTAAPAAAAAAASRPAWQQRSLSAGWQGSRYPSISQNLKSANPALRASQAGGLPSPSNISPPRDWPGTAGGLAEAGNYYNPWQGHSNISQNISQTQPQPDSLSSDAVAAAAAAAGGYVEAGYYVDAADKYAAQAQGLLLNLYVDTQGLRTPGLSDRPISPLRLQEYRAAAAGRNSPDSPRHHTGLPMQPGAAAAAAAAFDSYMQQQNWQQQQQQQQSASLLRHIGPEQQRLPQVLQFDSPAKAPTASGPAAAAAAVTGYQVEQYQLQSHAAAAAAVADRCGTHASLDAGLSGPRSSTPGRDKSSSRRLIAVDDIVTAMKALHGQQQTSPRAADAAAAAAGFGAFQAAQQLGGEATLSYPGIEGSGSLGALGYTYSPPRQGRHELRGFSGFSSQQQQQQQQEQMDDSPTLPPGSRGMGAGQLQSTHRPLQQLTHMQVMQREPGARYSTQQQQQQVSPSPQQQQQHVSSPGPQELGHMLAGVVQSVQGLDSMMASLMSSAAQRSPAAAAPAQQQQQQLLPQGQVAAAQEQHQADLQQPETATAAWLQHHHQQQEQQQQLAFGGSEDMLLMGSVVPATRTHALTPGAATAFAPAAPAAASSQQGTPQRVSNMSNMALQGGSSSAGPSPAAVVTAAAASVRRAMEELRVSAVSGWQQTGLQQQQQQQQLEVPAIGSQQPFQLPSAGGNPEAQCSAAGGGAWGGHGAERDWGGGVLGQQQQQSQRQQQQPAGSTQVVGSNPGSAQALHSGGVPRMTEESLQSVSQGPGGGSQQGPGWGSGGVAPKPQAQPSGSSPAGQGLVRALFTEGRPGNGLGDARSNTLALQQTQQSPQSQQQQQVDQQQQQQPQQHQELLQYLNRLESQVWSLQQQVLLNQWAQQATSDGDSTHAAAAAAASPQQDMQQQGQLGRASSGVQAAASPIAIASPAAPALGRSGGSMITEAGAVPLVATRAVSAAAQLGSPQGAAAGPIFAAAAGGYEVAAAAPAVEQEEAADETAEAQPLLDSLAQQVLQLQNSLRAMLAPEGSAASQQQHQREDDAWHEEDHPVSQQHQQQLHQQDLILLSPDISPNKAAPAAAAAPASSPGRTAALFAAAAAAAPVSPKLQGQYTSRPGSTAGSLAAAAAANAGLAAGSAPVSPSPMGHTGTSRPGSTAGSLAAAAANVGLAAGSAGSDAVLQRLTDMEVSMLANAHGLQALQDRLTKLEQRPALLPQQQGQDANQQQQQVLSAKVDVLVHQVHELQGAGGDVSNAAAAAAAARAAAQGAAAAAAEAAAAAVAAGQIVQQQEAAVLKVVEERMHAIAAAVQDSTEIKLAGIETSHLQLQQEAVGFAGQLQQLQEQHQNLQAGQVLLSRQQQLEAELNAGQALQQQLADRLQGLDSLQQQVRVLQEGVDVHAAAGCAAADASAAAAAAASDEVGRVREEVWALAAQLDDLQQKLQHDDDRNAFAGAGLSALPHDIEALRAQLQGVQAAVTALQEQQQAVPQGAVTEVEQQQEQQQAQQQAQQRLEAEVLLLSSRVGEVSAELAACSEAVSLTLPLRLVEVEDRVAATAQTCAEAVKVIALKHTSIGAMFAEVQTHQAAANTRIGQLSQQLASLRAARASKAASSSRHASSEGSL